MLVQVAVSLELRAVFEHDQREGTQQGTSAHLRNRYCASARLAALLVATCSVMLRTVPNLRLPYKMSLRHLAYIQAKCLSPASHAGSGQSLHLASSTALIHEAPMPINIYLLPVSHAA